jgi:2-isopropylmalate synthase
MSNQQKQIEVFDTTLRDGLQVEGVTATVDDKLRIAEQLDHLGVHFIEGGWPGANPKDIEFFSRAATELNLTTSTLVAFGSTRRPRGRVDEDATLQHLLDAQTPAVCIVAKSWDYHVIEALQTTLDEGEAMIADSVEFLAGHGRRVLVDMEHFFDGFKRNPEFALRALEAAIVKGATHVVLCDTNGGSLPHEIEEIVGAVYAHVGDDVTIGIHCHDDTGCAVANSMAAVRAGARHVQGTLNGLGERTGNANLTTIIPNLQVKQDYLCLPEGRLERLTVVSHRIAETLNRAVNPQAPYVGSSAFAHKAGLHVSAIKRARDAYEHVDPQMVGNDTRFVVSEMAGRATIQIKAEEIGLELDGPAVNQVIDDLKRLEHEGYHFEAADASLELLMRRASGWEHDFFRVESMRVITDEHAEAMGSVFNTEATVKVWVGDQRHVETAEGNGPVNAIDTAFRRAVQQAYPQLASVHLTDFKVRILDGGEATGAVTRVLLSASDGRGSGRRLELRHGRPPISPRRTARALALPLARCGARRLGARPSRRDRRVATGWSTSRLSGAGSGVRPSGRRTVP